MAMIGKPRAIQNMDEEAATRNATPEFARVVREQWNFEGTAESLASSISHFPFSGMESDYQKLGQQDFPILVMWGEQDKTVPYIGEEGIRSFLPQSTIVTVDTFDHDITYGRVDLVNQSVIELVKSAEQD